ncbi:hypothetical protein [Lacinutrix sp.]|uniref:hypothetical protein n=1 Tax=Lacinutrix sp. TaxID=1937692 RepID=UPI0035C7AE23
MNKKEIFYDENSKPIGMKEFKEKTKDRNYVSGLVENDTAFIRKISFREATGEMTPDLRLSLIKYLIKITESKIDSTNNIVIIFFYEPKVKPNGSCIDHYTSHRSYIKYFKKNKNNTQFFITEKGYNYRKKHVFEDKEDYIRQLLFKYNFGCGNYMIIKNDGSVFRILGEYRQDDIIQKINSKW